MARVTVIGAGLAGLSATLALAEAGTCVTLVSSQPSERAQSVMAEGGINAALDVMGEDDSPAQHAADTLRSAAGLADERAVRGLVEGAPGIVEWLISLGVPFNTERGVLVQRYFGGQRKARTAYAKSSTGKMVVSALVDAVRRHEAAGLVERLPNHELVGLRVEGGRCEGVVVRGTHTGEPIALGAPVILATGGYAGLFGPVTTGTTLNTGDVAALALAAGIELANLEFLQYHPTTAVLPDKRLLVSEAARGEGGRLFTLRGGEPWYFMEERYPDLGNLMPRDVVSREEAAVLADPACEGIWLDLRHLPRHVWSARLSDLRAELMHYLGIDAAKRPVPVRPAIHYCMGGLRVDVGHRTSVSGLLAAGECACAYHGANRLGGNSLLGALYGGRVAAASVLADAQGPTHVVDGVGTDVNRVVPPAFADAVSAGVAPASEVVPADAATNVAMQRELRGALGVVRDGAALEAALEAVGRLEDRDVSVRQRMRLLLARGLLSSALARRESRGAHWRSDFPETRDRYRKLTVVRCADGDVDVAFCEVGEGT